MATSSLHPSSNPFRDPNRTHPITPQPTGSTLNPFLAPAERVSPQATGASQYFTPQHSGAGTPQGTGAFTPQATGAITPQAFGAITPQPTGALNSQSTGLSSFSPHSEPPASTTYAPPPGPPPSHNTPSPTPQSPPQSTYAPPPGPPPQSTYAPPPGPPPRSPAAAPRAPSPPLTADEPPPPYTPAADTRHGEVPLETGPRRAYAPEWHPDGQTWRNEVVNPSAPASAPTAPSVSVSAAPASPEQGRGPSQWDLLTTRWTRERNHSPVATRPPVRPSSAQAGGSGSGGSGWSTYPGQGGGGSVNRPPPRHPSGSGTQGPALGRANTTAGTSSRPAPGPPTTVPTPGRALLNQGKVLAYPAGYECDLCHLTGYRAYDPSNPCRQCWTLFAQPYEGALTYAPWDSPEDVTSDNQNLQRPLPASVSRPQARPQQQQPSLYPQPSITRPISHPPHVSYGAPGSLPPIGWSSPSTSLRPQATVSFTRRPPPGSLVVRPGDPRIGGRVCWKCSGEGWQYKTMGLETKTCSACNGLGRLF